MSWKMKPVHQKHHKGAAQQVCRDPWFTQRYQGMFLPLSCGLLSPLGSRESLGHIESGKIPGPLLIHGFPYRFTCHPRGSALSSCSLCSHQPEKDNIRQRNLTFDRQMLAWRPDLNPPRCRGLLLSTLAHAVMRRWDRSQGVR